MYTADPTFTVQGAFRVAYTRDGEPDHDYAQAVSDPLDLFVNAFGHDGWHDVSNDARRRVLCRNYGDVTERVTLEQQP